MLRTKRFAVLIVIAAIFLTAIPAFSQSSNATWSGQVQCQLNDQDSNYTRQETQTWVLAGGGPISPTGMPAYNATWTATGQGQLQKVVGGQTINIQWTTNVPATTANINIFVRASDNRLIIKPWHAQLSVFNAVKGTRQVIVNGAAQPPTSFSTTAWEWQFPRIEDSGTATNVSGTSQSQADAGSAELIHHLGALPPNATCQWQLTQGPIAPTPTPPSIQAPVTNVNASAGDGSASVTWAAPTGASLAGYSVTATPMGLRMSAAASPVTFSGLTNGTAYTFQVVAINALGQQSAPATSNPVTPMSATPLIPVGVLAAPDHVIFGQTIALSGTQSHETGGQLTKYCFYVVGTPANLTPTDVSSIDSGGCGADPTRTIRAMPQPGPYAFSLYVYDQSGTASAEVRASVTVDAAPATTSSPTSTATVSPLASAGTIKTPVPVSQTLQPTSQPISNVGILLKPPPAPTGFTATYLNHGTVQLKWQVVSGAHQYRLSGPGLPSSGFYVPGTSNDVGVQQVPPGLDQWQIASVGLNNSSDPKQTAKTSLIIRYPPAHSPAWLSKANGAGNPALSLAHYLSLCNQCLPGANFKDVMQSLGLRIDNMAVFTDVGCGGYPWCGGDGMRWVDDQAARYTNVTEFENSARVTGCWTIGQPNGRIVCYTKTSDHGLQVIVRQTDASWFLSFSAPDPNAEVFDWVNYDAQTLNQIPPGQRFNSTYTLTNSVVLDSEGPKFAPHVCLACHGGQVTSNGVTGSTLLPLDPGLVKNTVVTIDGNYYGGDPSQLRTVNRVVMTMSPSAAVAKYLTGIYGVDPRVAISAGDPNYVPPSWTGETSTYKMVVKPYCMMCHLATPGNLDFTTRGNFYGNKELIYTTVCQTHSMPHTEAPYNTLWSKDTGNVFVPGYLATVMGHDSCP